MKIQIGAKKILFFLILYYHFIYILLATIDESQTLTNKLALLAFVLLYIFYFSQIAIKNRGLFFGSNIILIGYVLYSVAYFGFFQISRSDFYSFVLFIFLLLTFSNRSLCTDFGMFLVKYRRKYLFATLLFFVVLIYTVITGKGLHIGFGSVVPVLYGPYSVPHVLGYSLVGIYATIGILSKEDKNKIYFMIKMLCVICTIWTAARSAVLAIGILVFVDFVSVRNLSKKIILVGITILCLLYILLFTDLLVNNPLISKTISALDAGSITNGRERFIAILIDNYKLNTSFTQKLFGIGMNNVRQTMLRNQTIGVAIHAHNDYINMLCGYGAFGLTILIGLQCKLFTIFKSKFYALLLEVFVFILCYYNGLAMYTVFTPILPCIFMFFVVLEKGNNQNRLKTREGD
ncbi:MAG: O-antigen ligase family protein [Anaerostipes sp.]|jgi:hypothetical protein